MWWDSLPVVNYLFVFLAIIKEAESKKKVFVGVDVST
jgi:uncharacterized protein YktB (UPF0637 family)